MSYRSFAEAIKSHLEDVKKFIKGESSWKDPSIPFDPSKEVEGYRSFSFSKHQIAMANAIAVQTAHRRCESERDLGPEDYMKQYLDEVAFDSETYDALAPVVENELADIADQFPKVRDRLNREEPKLMSRYNRFDVHELGES